MKYLESLVNLVVCQNVLENILKVQKENIIVGYNFLEFTINGNPYICGT